MGGPDLESQTPNTIDGVTREEEEKAVKAGKGYDLPIWRKCIILFVVSWMTLAVTFSSTSLLPATPEIAEEFNTTTETLNITNAGVLLAMGFSSLIWGPMNNLIGRRISYNLAILMLCACSAATGSAVDLKMFTAFRVLGGLTGTSFMVSGQTILADIFEPVNSLYHFPVVRGTAVGFFMAGSVSGPAIGPCIGGLIVTFSSWRNIYWLQVGMTGLGLALSIIFVPEIKPETKEGSEDKEKMTVLSALRLFNPLRIFRQWVYPNVFFSDLTCGLLATFQYSLLTSARSIFNPRFHLTTALVSGLFYLAPGAGFLVGSIIGGKLSDRTDRLNSGLITLFAVLPVSTLIYGWTLQEEKGGMVVPILGAFFAGWGLMGSFNTLNTYVAEAIPHKRSEVIAGKYIVQYIFSAASSALVVPIIDAIGVGWTFTICVVFSIIGGLLTIATARWGLDMQQWAEKTFRIREKPGF
ncbi:hypothetical protein ETB97_010769 [Aspergillus alliaceus]|uniref:Major facilitator superfamily (MFS) profile domain-containing protein n=1 Tax=Petromyces alliaceus TaxID=209559 RepID=A0A8H6AGF0_PETAA|nr:hypothetical protein ETB97_010769 [Aspergillus burnettii]